MDQASERHFRSLPVGITVSAETVRVDGWCGGKRYGMALTVVGP